MRRFYLKDFPENAVRVSLKKQKSFLENFVNRSGSLTRASKFLGVDATNLIAWRNGLFIPLWAFKKISSFSGLKWNVAEKIVISYKGVGVSEPITEPILPVRESPELFGLIAHLIGDGSVSREGVPQYINSQKASIENLKNILRRTFGEVQGKVYFRRVGKTYFYRFSRTIPLLLRHFYGSINFDSEKALLPERIFKLPEEFACEVIRAFVDDEGSIRDTRIVIALKNKELIFQLNRLLTKLLGENSTRITYRGENYWVVTIRAGVLPKLSEKIRLKHPHKSDALAHAVNKLQVQRRGKHDGIWETKMRILELLKDGGKETKEIANKLFIQTSNISTQLNRLAAMGLAKRVRKRKFAFVWKLTRKGAKFLTENSLKTNKSKRIKIPDFQGLFKLKSPDVLFLLSAPCRKKLFWFLERIFKSDQNTSKFLGVHRNSVYAWKSGKKRISARILKKILFVLGKHGIDLTEYVLTNIKEIRSKNGILLYRR